MSAKNNLSIAEKTAKLNEIVAWFDGEEFELEKALEKFTEAEKLAAEIEDNLVALKNDIQVVKERFDKTS
jgi:exonuclease VII small subunit